MICLARPGPGQAALQTSCRTTVSWHQAAACISWVSGPTLRPITTRPHWLGSDQRTNHTPPFVDTDWDRQAAAGNISNRVEIYFQWVLVPALRPLYKTRGVCGCDVDNSLMPGPVSGWMVKCCVKSTIKWCLISAFRSSGAAQPSPALPGVYWMLPHNTALCATLQFQCCEECTIFGYWCQIVEP